MFKRLDLRLQSKEMYKPNVTDKQTIKTKIN